MTRRKNVDTLVVVLVFLAAVAGPAGGGTIYVDPNGSADFTTIQAAIDDANDGDEIEVAPGTYNEAIDFKGKAVRLYSSGGTEVTTIDASGLETSVATCISGEDANTVLEGFTITGDHSYDGGGMFNLYSSPTVINCTFTGNTETNNGGGMYNTFSSPTVTDCTFSGNTAISYGGGMHNYHSSPTVTNCTFSGNTAVFGGGMHNRTSSNPNVTNCTFSSNTATNDGGGIYNAVSSPTMTNCTFSGNTASSSGGGIYNFGGSPTVTNCTFSGNSTTTYGGGMYNEISSPTVTNCILWGDTPDEIYDDGASNTAVTYSDVEGGWPDANNTNIDADPLFIGSLHLAGGSPCIDAGDNLAVPADVNEDIEGNSRIIDGDSDSNATVDMGAYEYGGQPVEIWVDDDYWEGGENDGHIWGYDAFAVIGEGIMAAGYGSTVHVAGGTYAERITLKNGVGLMGAGAGDTVIDAGGSGRVVYSSGCDANTILEGFTITGGDTTDGGGMYNNNSSPTVTNCTFSGNSAGRDGGGMYNNNSSPTVTNCMFSGNSGTWGGGMYNLGGSPTVTNCTFIGNTAAYVGGGMYNRGGSPTVTNCTFSGNSASENGGGMYNYLSSPTVTNCTFSGNPASWDGGGIYNRVSSPTMTNCTFSGNTASSSGGGMYNMESSPTVTNCTFSGNSAFSGGGMRNENPSSPTVINCTFSGNTAVFGGGMYNLASSPTVTNCTFSGNSADGGGGMVNDHSSPTVSNCTFSSNPATNDGGGMYNYNSSPTVTNCIMWGDSAGTSGNEIYNSGGSTLAISYSDIEGCGGSGAGWNGSLGTDGGGNIDAEPSFFAPAIDDFHLKSEFGRATGDRSLPYGSWLVDTVTSPCIDAGDPNMDVGNEPEGNGGRINMGSYGGTYQASKSSYPIEGDINDDGRVDFKDIAVVAGNWLAGTEPE